MLVCAWSGTETTPRLQREKWLQAGVYVRQFAEHGEGGDDKKDDSVNGREEVKGQRDTHTHTHTVKKRLLICFLHQTMFQSHYSAYRISTLVDHSCIPYFF